MMKVRKTKSISVDDSENIYKAIFENSIDAILLTTPDGRIQAANPAACKMFGCSEDQIVKGGLVGCLIKLILVCTDYSTREPEPEKLQDN